MTALLRAAILQLILLGYRVVPLAPRSKNPTLPKWQDLRVTADRVAEVFDENANVGAILGDGVVDVDLDAPEAVRMADHFLPPTTAEWGRRSKPRSHRLYAIDVDAPGRITFAHDAMLLEIRGKNHQSMAPPSVHPSGEVVEWTRGEAAAPSAVSFEELLLRCRLLAAAVVLTQHWPKTGDRNDAGLAAAGLLLDCSCSQEQAIAVITASAQYADDEEWGERAACVEATARKREAGEPTTGGPRLAELLGDRGDAVVTKIREILGLKRSGDEALLHRMNRRFFVVRVGGKVVVGDEGDAGELVLMPRHEFVALDPAKVATGEGRAVLVGKLWLDQTARRQYGRITFAPQPRVVRATDYNMWTGFATEPRLGDWSKLRLHFLEVWCQGKVDRLDYVLDWFALLAQRPGTPAEIALVLRGGRGTGKSWPVRAIGTAWFGRHFAHISSAGHLTGRFNAALSVKVLVFADEAFWAGDKTAERELKRLITEPTLGIERKGIDPIEEPNCIHLIIAGNDDHLVPAGVDERRFAVLDVTDVRRDDRDHFRALGHEFNAGGAAAFLHDMLLRPVDLDRIKAGLDTEALADQKLQSLDSVGKFWHERLAAGTLVDSDMKWTGKVATEVLHEAYCQAAGRVGERRKSTETEFWKKLRKFLPEGWPKKTRGTAHGPGGSIQSTRRAYYMEFPSLETCRNAFDDRTRHKWDWVAAEDGEVSF